MFFNKITPALVHRHHALARILRSSDCKPPTADKAMRSKMPFVSVSEDPGAAILRATRDGGWPVASALREFTASVDRISAERLAGCIERRGGWEGAARNRGEKETINRLIAGARETRKYKWQPAIEIRYCERRCVISREKTPLHPWNGLHYGFRFAQGRWVYIYSGELMEENSRGEVPRKRDSELLRESCFVVLYENA